jgi:hypothetical protein
MSSRASASASVDELLVDLPHRNALQREQVALVDDAAEPAVLDHRELADPALGHRLHRLPRRRRCRQRRERRAHDRRQRGIERDLGQDHAAQQVDQGEHPDRRALVVERDDRAHAAVVHALRRLAHGRARRDGDGRVAQEVRQGSRQRLLDGGALAVLPVEALERLAQRFSDGLRAIALELGRERAQREEVRPGEHEARGIGERREHARGGAAGRKGADREELAGAERPIGLGVRVVGSAADGAALHDRKQCHGAACRREDRRVPCKARARDMRYEEGKRFAAHPVERRVAAKECANTVGIDRGGAAHAAAPASVIALA